MRPRDWRNLQRHPLSAEYPDIAGEEWACFVSNLRVHGIVGDRKIILHNGQILDGWQLFRACLETDFTPEFQELPPEISPEEYVAIVNDSRRHETREALATRRLKVLEKRVAGESLRKIADDCGVSHTTVARDLAAVTSVTAEPNQNDGASCNLLQPQTVTGKDGRTYQSKKIGDELDPKGQLVDSLGRTVPGGLIPVFNKVKNFKELLHKIGLLGRAWAELKENQILGVNAQDGVIDLKNFRETVRFACPYAVCPQCMGNAKTRPANCACKQRGWLVEGQYKVLPAEFRE